MYKYLRKIIIIILCGILLSVSPTHQVLAFNNIYDAEYYWKNNIYYYNPQDGCGDSGYAISGNVSIEDNESLKKIYQGLLDGGMSSVQVAAVMGNMKAESSFNSDAHEIGNDIGYGLVQWSFGRRVELENYAKSKNVHPSDVDMQIEFLLKEYNEKYKKRLKGSSFESSNDIGRATEAWMLIFEVPKMSPANDPAHLFSVRIPAAQKIYDLYNNIEQSEESKAKQEESKSEEETKTTIGVDTIPSTYNCATGNGAVAGNIVETALNFALTSPAANGMIEESDARDTYRQAKPTINPKAAWSDCGGFVATVMHASGVDEDYPLLGVRPNQTPYVKKNSDKYEVIENIKMSDLQPGDIMLTSGHTIIYTGKSTYPAVDASLGERVPSVQTIGTVQWMLERDAIIARIKK